MFDFLKNSFSKELKNQHSDFFKCLKFNCKFIENHCSFVYIIIYSRQCCAFIIFSASSSEQINYSKTSINEHLPTLNNERFFWSLQLKNLYKMNTRAPNYTFVYETREKRD